MASLRVVFSGTYFELWSGDSIPNLAKIWSGTNSNKNQTGWCGVAGGSATNSGYVYWDDVTIENWD
jgi:hypothetical protein